MSNDKRDSTQRALNKFFERAAKELEPKAPRRKNERPEKQVEKECLIYMKGLDWDVAIYEAKATYNPKAGRYVSSAMKAGTCDCMGAMPNGIAVFIEFKAPGKLSTFNKNQRQREFLVNKIKMNCFGCVVDSHYRLREIYTRWEAIRIGGTIASQKYLLEMLPEMRSKNTDFDL